MNDLETTYWGLKLYEWLTLAAIVIGPIVAVRITHAAAQRGKDREQKLQVLRMLIATHHLPSDPTYQVAINLIPIEFRGCRPVIDAHREFIASIGKRLDGVNDEAITRDYGMKSIRLVHQVAKALQYDLRETDLQTAPYVSKGWAERDAILLDSQKAMRDIATLLFLQSRQMSGTPLNDEEMKYLGLIRNPDA